MKRDAITLDWTLRVFVLHAVVAKLLADGVEVLVASLDKFKVPQKEKGEILSFVTSLKKDIVEKQ